MLLLTSGVAMPSWTLSKHLNSLISKCSSCILSGNWMLNMCLAVLVYFVYFRVKCLRLVVCYQVR